MNPKTKRHLLLALGLILLSTVTGLVGVMDQGQSDPLARRPSSFFHDSGGTLALYRLLEQFTPGVARMQKPFTSLATHHGPDTILVMRPANSLGQKEYAALETWIREGGQLIIATDEDWPVGSTRTALFDNDDEPPPGLLHHLGLHFIDQPQTQEDFSKQALAQRLSGKKAPEENLEQVVLDRHILSLHGRSLGYTSPEANHNPSLVQQLELGAGRVIAIGDARAWSNQRLRFYDNELWLLDAVREHGAGEVWIDEYHQGFAEKRHFLALIFDFLTSAWGLAFVQLLIAGVLLVLGPWRRFGSIRKTTPQQVQDPLELVDARAQFLKHAAAHEFCFQMMHQHLLERLAHFGMVSIHSQFQDALAGKSSRLKSPQWVHYLSLYAAYQNQNLTTDQLNSAAQTAAAILEEHHHE